MKGSPAVIDLWECSLLSETVCLRYLTEGEIKRANSFRSNEHRARWILSRQFLRRILAQYIQCPPEGVGFCYTEYGKPYLIGDSVLNFNLSHSRSKAVLAVTKASVDVGIDIEFIEPEFASLEIARQFFSRSEIHSLKSIPEDKRVEAFFCCWTRKEAFIKAVGMGLSVPLDTFSVSLSFDLKPFVVQTDIPGGWFVYPFSVEAGYCAALAVNAFPGSIVVNRMGSDK